MSFNYLSGNRLLLLQILEMGDHCPMGWLFTGLYMELSRYGLVELKENPTRFSLTTLGRGHLIGQRALQNTINRNAQVLETQSRQWLHSSILEQVLGSDTQKMPRA